MWKLTSYDLQTSSDGSSNLRTVVHGSKPGFLVVCSHDCDIENVRDRAGLAVAPLDVPSLPWPGGDARWETLRSSWEPTGDAFEFGHLFPLHWDDPPGIRIIDFSRLTTAGPVARPRRCCCSAR